MSGSSTCRRRQILDHFGDSSAGAPIGRCCDVCDPDPELARALTAAPVSSARRGSSQSTKPLRERYADRRPSADPVSGSPVPLADPVDEREFERLRQWRWARAEGKPAFTVAANSVLEEILRRRPHTTEALLQIRGIGPAFCAKHGDSLLAELGEVWADAPRETSNAGTAAIASVPAPT